MRLFSSRICNSPGCKRPVLFLAICWLLGIAIGIVWATTVPSSVFSLMLTSLCRRVSIVGLLVVLVFPLFSSAVAFLFNRLRYIYLLAFLKGICYGFCILILLILFGKAAWLVRCFILFSDSCVLIPLFLFWIRHLNCSSRGLCKDVIYCFALSFLAGAVDYLFVSPFAHAMIMKF